MADDMQTYLFENDLIHEDAPLDPAIGFLSGSLTVDLQNKTATGAAMAHTNQGDYDFQNLLL